MNARFPFPKRCLVYLTVILICSVLLVANVYRTDSWTGDKAFSAFSGRDWQLFFIFIIEEIVIIGVLLLFVFLMSDVCKKRNLERTMQRENNKVLGTKPGDYDFIWFDFANDERVLILRQGNIFKLYVHKYDMHTGNWVDCSGVSVYDSLEAVKKALFCEYGFYCDENAELDKYGAAIYKEN